MKKWMENVKNVSQQNDKKKNNNNLNSLRAS